MMPKDCAGSRYRKTDQTSLARLRSKTCRAGAAEAPLWKGETLSIFQRSGWDNVEDHGHALTAIRKSKRTKCGENDDFTWVAFGQFHFLSMMICRVDAFAGGPRTSLQETADFSRRRI